MKRNLTHPYSITVDSKYLYWSDWTKKGIFRILKDYKPSDKESMFISGLSNIRDIHFYNASRQQGKQGKNK